MDSRQVYAGMDVGTAKPSPQERALIPHYGLDVVKPDQRYSAGLFAADARVWIERVHTAGRIPILVGGTGFFLRALTHPMFPEPPLDGTRKEALKHYLERLTRAELLQWLSHLDHANAVRMQKEGGRQRLARAIEVALLTGRPLSEWHEAESADAPLRFLTFVIDLPRAQLYERINQRVEDMVRGGLVEEVTALRSLGYDENAPAMNATGYLEVLSFLRGDVTLEIAIDEIKRTTRRYARRQITWFRHQLPADAIMLDGTRPGAELAEEVANAWHRRMEVVP